MADAKLTQDIRVILQQVLSRLPEGGNQINIIAIANQEVTEIPLPGLKGIASEFDLIKYIEALPQPRMQNLMAKIIELAVEKFPTKQEAIKWLGISYTTMYRYREVEKLFQETELK